MLIHVKLAGAARFKKGYAPMNAKLEGGGGGRLGTSAHSCQTEGRTKTGQNLYCIWSKLCKNY